jgi:hypothetical protein
MMMKIMTISPKPIQKQLLQRVSLMEGTPAMMAPHLIRRAS